MMEEHGPSKSPRAGRSSAGCSSARLGGDEDSGRLDPRHRICSKLRKLSNLLVRIRHRRGFRKWLANLKRLWLEEKQQPGLLGEWLFTL